MVCGVVCSWAGPVPRGKQQHESGFKRDGFLDALIAPFLKADGPQSSLLIGDVENLSVTTRMQVTLGGGKPVAVAGRSISVLRFDSSPAR
jgi:hypothetical protein